MSIHVMNRVWMDSPAKGSELLILLAIADFANDEGVAWPGVETLAKKARLSKRQTQYNIRSLVKSGLLEMQENAGPRGTHLYRVMGVQGLHGANTARVQPTARGGAKSDTEGVQPIAPEPSVEPSKNRHGIGADAPAKPKRATQVPEDFTLTPSLETWGADNGFTVEQMRAQIPQFQDHYRAKGEPRKDWDASFRTWMRNARKWGHLETNTPANVTQFQQGRRGSGRNGGYTASELLAMGRGDNS